MRHFGLISKDEAELRGIGCYRGMAITLIPSLICWAIIIGLFFAIRAVL